MMCTLSPLPPLLFLLLLLLRLQRLRASSSRKQREGSERRGEKMGRAEEAALEKHINDHE